MTGRADVLWYGPLASPTGFAEEGRNFVCQLRRAGVALAARTPEQHRSPFLEQLARDQPSQILELNAAMAAESSDDATVILHLPAAGCPPPPIGAARAVCRTMWETDGLHPSQVATFNRYDELWVPSTFNATTFAAAGVHTPITIVPSGLDTHAYRPGGRPLRIGALRATVFLSIFEWSHRKAPDVLLQAWARAFRPSDDVTLLLRCYPPNGFLDGRDRTAAVDGLIEATLTRIGLAREQLAPIVVVGQHLSPNQMPSLYASSSCYVSPARGEGWGRPLTEAMACGLPVIATRWGAPLEFLDDDNAFPLEIDGLEPVGTSMGIAAFEGQSWAAPSVEHLSELLARVAGDPKGARRVGEAATRSVQRYSWRRVASIARDALVARGARSARAAATPLERRHAGRDEPLVCTAISRRQLAYARVLAARVERRDMRLHVLVVDAGENETARSDEPFSALSVGALGIELDTFARLALSFDEHALCRAMVPYLGSFALARASRAVVVPYDLCLLEDPTGLRATGGDARCGGVLELCPDDEAALATWRGELRAAREGAVEAPGALLEGGPTRTCRGALVHLGSSLHAPGLLLASDGRLLVGGRRLGALHFEQFDPLAPPTPEEVECWRAGRRDARLRALLDLREAYRSELLAAGHRLHARAAYGFSHLPSGEQLTPERREAYRSALALA